LTVTVLSGPVVLADSDGNVISSQDDAGVRRIEIAGKVVVQQAVPPPLTVGFVIHGDTPKTVSSHDTVFVIPDTKVAHIQALVGGNEDPTKGAVIEVWYDENGTEHLIARMYTAGASELFGFADIMAARDGTSLLGNAGGTNKIILRRTKFQGTDIAIDAVVRGYTV
jgi:hypothetical protein